MDKDGSNSVSIEEIVDYFLLHGQFDLGTKSNRDFSTSVLRKMGNDHMNRAEFEHFWLDFYEKFFKMDTNNDQFVSVIETINYFDAHDIESFRQAGAYLKQADLNLGLKRKFENFWKFSKTKTCENNKILDGRMSVLEFFISFPDLEKILGEHA